MPALQQTIFKSSVVIDKDLHILSGDSYFYRFVNCLDVKDLSAYLSVSDQHLLRMSLQNEEKKKCILYFHVRETIKECIVSIKNNQECYELCIYDYDGIIEKLDTMNISLRKGMGLLSLVDVLFFDYDVKCCHVLISSGKALEVIKEFDIKNFKEELSLYLGVESNHKELVSLENDLVNEIYLKEYSFDDYVILTTPIYDNDMKIINIIGIINDKKGRIQTRGFYNLDGLTQILNKNAIVNLAKTQIDVAKKPFAFIIIDIDNFKTINDTYGHQFGDQVLIKSAKIMKESVGKLGYVGRFGGDEFVIIIDNQNESVIREVLRNIKLGIQWAYSDQLKDLVITCSMGCSRYPADGENYDDVFFLADKCLYLAKRKGRNCYIIYDKEKHESIIVSKEELDRNIFFSNNVNVDVKKYADLISEYPRLSITEILKKLCVCVEANRCSLYKNNKFISSVGVNPIDTRSLYLGDKYFQHFMASGIMINNNINQYEVVDHDFFLMYFDAQIVGSLEMRKEVNDNEILIVLDKIGKPQTKAWKDTDVSFAILLFELIKERI